MSPATSTSRRDRRRHQRTLAADARDQATALLPELAGQVVPRRRHRHRLLGLASAVITVGLVIAVFLGFWWYAAWSASVSRQVDTTVPVAADADRAAYRAAAAAAAVATAGTGRAPIVLTYHDIGPNEQGSPYVVSPTAFAAQLAMLRDAGYRTLTADQFVAYARGRYTPPSRSVLITFDDGTRGLWTYADPVLERFGFTAVSFLITERVGTHAPYYLSWAEVERMRDSGRWQFGSHTANSHTKIDTLDGKPASKLTSRLRSGGARESLTHFRARISADLNKSVHDLAQHGLPRPALFAWPFSDITGAVADPQAARAAVAQVHRMFDVAFVDITAAPHPATRAAVDAGTVERLELMSDDTARDLFDRMAAMSTLPVRAMAPTLVSAQWLETGGHPAPMDVAALRYGVVTVEARSLTWLSADWAPQRTSSWTDYRVDADVTVASAEATAGLRARVGGPQEVAVRLSQRSATVTAGGRLVREVALADLPAPARRHHVALSVRATRTDVTVDGRLLARVPVSATSESQGGFGIVFGRAAAAEPWGRLSQLRVRPLAGS